MPATRSDSSEAFRGRLRRQRKSGSTHPKIGQPSAHLNYPATLNSFRSCLKVIDTFRFVDEFTRECLAILVAKKLTSEDVLERL